MLVVHVHTPSMPTFHCHRALVSMISASLSYAVAATEVVALQVKKGIAENDSPGQIATDAIESVYDNGLNILLPTTGMKLLTTAGKHAGVSMLAKCFGVNQRLQSTLGLPQSSTLAGVFVTIAWAQTFVSIFSEDPVERANERGYSLK